MKEEKITITNAQELRQEKCNVPTLRFKRYTTEWTKISLSNYLFVSSKRNKDGRFSKEDVLSVSGELGIVNQIALLGRSYAGESVLPYHIVEKGDIVYTKSPLALYPYGIIKTNRNKVGIVSTLYAVYKTKDNANNRFIEHYFSLKSRINNYLKPIVRIGAKHDMKIGNNEVLDNIVTFPDISEQCEIADFLDLLDNRISVQNKIISDLKVLKKELCRKMLSSITEYKTLGELCSITTGKLDANANNQNGLYPFFTCGKDTLSINNYAFDGEAILIAGNGDIGHTKYYYGKFNAYQRTYVLMGFKADAQFVKMGIDTYLPQKISEEMQGGAMPYIKLSTLTSLKIPFTTEEKQLSIRNHYDTIAQKVENETKILDLLLQQKSYFLNAMFI